MGYLDADLVTIANNVTTGGSTVTFDTAVLSSNAWKIGDVFIHTTVGLDVEESQVSGLTEFGLELTTQLTAVIDSAMTVALVKRQRDHQQSISKYDGKNTISVLFTPPLGIMSSNVLIPTSDIRLDIMPKSSKNGAFEFDTATSAITPSLMIKHVYFYAYVFTTDRVYKSGRYFLYLDELNVSAKPLLQGTSQTTHTFSIPSSTISIATFVQDAQSATPSALNIPPSVFKNRDYTSADIKSLMLTYSNLSKPTILYSTEFSDDTQGVVQRYFQMASNANLDMTSLESFDSWLNRGQVWYTTFVRSSEDRSTSLQVQIEFNSSIPAHSQLFIAVFYRQCVAITVENGFVSNVERLAV
jgi:hypothetical protein